MAFPRAWMDELLYRSDIVSVISSYIDLKPKGSKYWGLCPLHGEKTPSFSVSADKQLFYCFGCHAGGNVIGFLMQMDHLTFPEAVEKLAQRAGMPLPEQTDDSEAMRERAYRERLYAATKSAARYYMETLIGEDGLAGRRYLKKRGISSEAVKRFGLGYAKPGWDNLKKVLTEQGFSEKELIDAGLLVRNERKDSVYDAYRDRVIFPIIDISGRVLGFGARVMTDEKPKYINTGDTPIYNKRNNLYGLNMQKGKKLTELIMVEGYMDVIGLFEQGVTNVVASLGTALTMQQARLLKRYVDSVFIAYDGDSAGQNAMIRGLDILREAGIDVRVIVFPEGLDPDEYIRKYGKDAFDRLRDDALTLNAFKLERMADGFDLTSENDRERYVKEGCAFIAKLEPVERERYYRQLAQKTGYPVETLKVQGDTVKPIEEKAPQRRPLRFRGAASEELSGRVRAEAVLLANMELSSTAATRAAELGAIDLIRTPCFQAYALGVVSAFALEETPSPAALMNGMTDEETAMLAKVFASGFAVPGDPEKAVSECVARLKKFDREEQVELLKQALNDSTRTKEETADLLKQFSEMKKTD